MFAAIIIFIPSMGATCLALGTAWIAAACRFVLQPWMATKGQTLGLVTSRAVLLSRWVAPTLAKTMTRAMARAQVRVLLLPLARLSHQGGHQLPRLLRRRRGGWWARLLLLSGALWLRMLRSLW